ncbi:hypothetical protein SEVIR_6G200500v4 [Setaria viridis]
MAISGGMLSFQAVDGVVATLGVAYSGSFARCYVISHNLERSGCWFHFPVRFGFYCLVGVFAGDDFAIEGLETGGASSFFPWRGNGLGPFDDACSFSETNARLGRAVSSGKKRLKFPRRSGERFPGPSSMLYYVQLRRGAMLGMLHWR